MKEHNNEISFENQIILDVEMEKEVKKSFIEYSMSVITSRALPDVRDGMKPGQRRIMYAMFEDHLTHDRPFCKSATTVGNVLGRYHPHGDAAVYGTMVRMAQDFSLRYPLVEGHGNFGSVDGDGAAAYRYTEARMSKMADELMRDIEKDVVDFMPNFDNRRREPTVLPSRFPNLLVNGSVGIAVGMATYIPPHNLREVINATVYRMDNPECSAYELMQFVKGPDFPTAATIYGENGIKEAYLTGKGRVMVRARAEVDEAHNRIIVTEIPYQVNKSMLCESIAQLVKDKKIEGITGLRDESGRNGMRIVIEHRRDVNGQIILNQLYKFTQLEDTCAVNMVALVKGEPKTLSLPEILDAYIEHQKDVIIRRYQYDLKKAKARAHILEGYKIAMDNIDEIVELMKTSKSIPDSKARLMEKYGLSELQAQAIVEMTLGRLTGLERQKVEDELARLYALIADIEDILSDINKIKDVIKREMLEIAQKYGDDRKTEIVPVENEIGLEDLIEKHTCIITMTSAGYIKRQNSETYQAQRRGGKGIIGMTAKEEDYIERVVSLGSHDYLMMFTNTGKVHMRKAFMIPEASRTAKGSNIVNVLSLENGETVTAMIAVRDFDTAEGDENDYLVMVTRRGVVKKTLLSEFERQRKNGKIAILLDEGDELVYVMHTNKECDLVIASRKGRAVRFTVDDETLRPMGRSAHGVRGIKLKDDDGVAGVAIVDESKYLITVTENGYGKLTEFDDMRSMKNRGGSGFKCHNVSERTGDLAGIATVARDEDVMMITDAGMIVRTPVEGVPVYSRTASGVIMMRLAEGTRLVNFTVVTDEYQEEE